MMNDFTKEELQIIYNHIYYNAPLSCTIEIRNKEELKLRICGEIVEDFIDE